MSLRPKALILDEPTSSLSGAETRLLFRNIRGMKDEGTSLIYISHNLPEIFEIADRVTVLRDGTNVGTCDVAGVSEDQLIRMMVGRELANMYGTRTSEIGEPYFRLESASRGERFRDVSFTLRRGEILGLAGLVGAGRTDLGRAIFGAEPLERGRAILDGKPIAIRNPGQAIRNGIGYLTEDRREQGLFLRMALRDNCAAPSLSRFTNALGWIRERAVTDFAEACRARFNIVTPGVRQQVRNLSGGNQQKVLLSMWTGHEPRLLIADEPTRGVDVGAKSEIYAFLRDLAARGVGILMISSDLNEILGLSDRVLVMRQGRIAGEFGRAEATEENVIACAAGVATG
jgi:ABC-type sugar transport system ATPase subunit